MPDFCLYLFGQKAAEDLWQRLPETLVLTGSLLPRYVLLCTFYSLNTVLTGSLLPSSSLADSWWPLYSPNFAFWASWTQQISDVKANVEHNQLHNKDYRDPTQTLPEAPPPVCVHSQRHLHQYVSHLEMVVMTVNILIAGGTNLSIL